MSTGGRYLVGLVLRTIIGSIHILNKRKNVVNVVKERLLSTLYGLSFVNKCFSSSLNMKSKDAPLGDKL